MVIDTVKLKNTVASLKLESKYPFLKENINIICELITTFFNYKNYRFPVGKLCCLTKKYIHSTVTNKSYTEFLQLNCDVNTKRFLTLRKTEISNFVLVKKMENFLGKFANKILEMFKYLVYKDEVTLMIRRNPEVHEELCALLDKNCLYNLAIVFFHVETELNNHSVFSEQFNAKYITCALSLYNESYERIHTSSDFNNDNEYEAYVNYKEKLTKSNDYIYKYFSSKNASFIKHLTENIVDFEYLLTRFIYFQSKKPDSCPSEVSFKNVPGLCVEYLINFFNEKYGLEENTVLVLKMPIPVQVNKQLVIEV